MDDGVSIFVVAIIGLALWLNISSNFIKNEITIYKLECSEKLVDGICKTTSHTAFNYTYKALEDKQSVIFWIDGGSIYKFPSCAVRDYKNWTCSEKTPLGDVEYIMNDGEYTVADYRNDAAWKNLFNTYTVPKWKWYYYYLKGEH